MLKEIMGYYMPSGFSICLDKTLPDEFNQNDSTFIHEYIHFLQDIILPYCIRENLVLINDFAWVCKKIEEKGKLIVPFNDYSDITGKQTEYTWGNGKCKAQIGKIVEIAQDYFTSCYGHNIYRYFLKFDDGTIYQIGARDFLEYLAHKIQSKFWKTNAPDLPYRTVDKLFEYYKLDFIPEAVRLLVIEYCLYNDNPVHFLINLFINQKLIENNKEVFKNYDECAISLLGLGWQSKGGFDETIFSKTKRRLRDLNERMALLYPHRQFDSMKKWIENTIKICNTNLSNIFIISSLYNLEREELYRFIDELMKSIGIPIVVFRNKAIRSFIPEQYNKEQFIEFYILKEFMGWIHTRDRGCPIYQICAKNYNMQKGVCKKEPEKYDETCIFKLFLKSYCLDNLVIEYT